MKNTWPTSIWRDARNHSKSETSKLQKQWDLYIPTSISLSLFLPTYIYFRSIFALDWQKTSELCNTNERSGEMGTLTLMCQAQMWTCTTRPTSVRPSMFITDKPGIPLLGIHPKGFTSKSTSGFCWGFSWLHWDWWNMEDADQSTPAAVISNKPDVQRTQREFTKTLIT